MTATSILDVVPVRRLDKDLVEASEMMTLNEVRFLVDGYYTLQEYRKALANQVRSCADQEEPAHLLKWLLRQAETLEGQIKRSLDKWTDKDEVGAWMKSHVGVGPVIAAGMRSHIDIERAPTAGHIWRLAGLDPNMKWLGTKKASDFVRETFPQKNRLTKDDVLEACTVLNRRSDTVIRLCEFENRQTIKKEKLAAVLARRPWNAKFKVLCWKLGQSFLKFHNQDECYYGHLYAQRKAQEVKKNEKGDFSDLAEKALDEKNYGAATEARKAYEQGKLPAARIDLRAQRYAVKIFLSHLQEVWHFAHFGELAPKPYAIEHLGHAHYLYPPNTELIEGFDEEKKKKQKRRKVIKKKARITRKK